MSAAVEIRDEAPDGPAAGLLWVQYLTLLADRVPGFFPDPRIFGTVDVFTGPGAAWVVAYDGAGEPIGCGGLRTLQPGVGEIKRMFVAETARRNGLGRRLLRELEQRAATAGLERVRVLTTTVLREACVLYLADGYATIRVDEPGGGYPVEIWMEKTLRG